MMQKLQSDYFHFGLGSRLCLGVGLSFSQMFSNVLSWVGKFPRILKLFLSSKPRGTISLRYFLVPLVIWIWKFVIKQSLTNSAYLKVPVQFGFIVGGDAGSLDGGRVLVPGVAAEPLARQLLSVSPAWPLLADSATLPESAAFKAEPAEFTWPHSHGWLILIIRVAIYLSDEWKPSFWLSKLIETISLLKFKGGFYHRPLIFQ